MSLNAVTLIPHAEGIKSVYTRLLSAKQADFVCLSTGYAQVLGAWYDDEFAPKLFASKVVTREIVAETAENRAYGQTKDQVKNLVRYSTKSAETDLIMCESFVAMVCYNPSNPFAVVMEDGQVTKSAQAWFEMMWEGAAR